jgi:hypothetical protein
MSRDSLFGETILWSGTPKDTSTSPVARVIMAVSGGVALVSLSFAVVLSTALHVAASGLILFAGWCSALALLAYCGPRLWRTGVEYAVTDRHVIWRRGPIRRSIDRDSISYARIRWSTTTVGVGDLVLVRAVPTGALRRTLSLTLSDVVAPDRVWAIARGVTPSAPLGDGERPLPQRLDEGERVVWSGTPVLAPWTFRRFLTATLAVGVGLAAARSANHVIPTLRRIAHLHALPGWSFALFVAAVVASVLFVAVVAGGVGYVACVRPSRLARATRYLVTNRRVLIRRGREELSLDRTRIADVISSPTRRPLRDGSVPSSGGAPLVDLFLVLDGPHARAFASSGAFREEDGDALIPVLSAIEDAETVDAILRGVVLGGELATAA